MDMVFGYFHTSEVVLSKLYTIRFLFKSNIVALSRNIHLMWFVITIMVLVTFLFSFFFLNLYILYFRCTLVYEFYIFGENFEYYLAIGAFALLLKRAQEYYSSGKLLTNFLIILD